MTEQFGFWVACVVLIAVVAGGCPFPGDMVGHLNKVCASEYGENWWYDLDHDACIGSAPVPEGSAK